MSSVLIPERLSASRSRSFVGMATSEGLLGTTYLSKDVFRSPVMRCGSPFDLSKVRADGPGGPGARTRRRSGRMESQEHYNSRLIPVRTARAARAVDAA